MSHDGLQSTRGNPDLGAYIGSMDRDIRELCNAAFKAVVGPDGRERAIVSHWFVLVRRIVKSTRVETPLSMVVKWIGECGSLCRPRDGVVQQSYVLRR